MERLVSKIIRHSYKEVYEMKGRKEYDFGVHLWNYILDDYLRKGWINLENGWRMTATGNGLGIKTNLKASSLWNKGEKQMRHMWRTTSELCAERTFSKCFYHSHSFWGSQENHEVIKHDYDDDDNDN